MGSQLLEEHARDMALSPADCRTLEKILHDVRSPPPLSPTRYSRDKRTRSLDAKVLGTNSMYPRDANQDLYAEGCYGHGDEREDGYEDEDDSMELSDIDGLAVSVQDFGAFYPPDESMSDEARETKQHRERIEEDLRRQVLLQDVADVRGSHDNDIGVVQALQEDTFMHSLQEEEADVSALEALGTDTESSLSSTSSRNHIRRASDASPPLSISFINFASNPRAVVQTPNGIHIDFTSSATIPTQTYFNTINTTSPSKRRRKASSPEELAELAREAAVEEAEADEEAELRGLEKYREMDLAPLEPVMESKSAGDLIVSGTPVKVRDEDVFGWKSSTLDFEILSSLPFVFAHEAVLDLDGATGVRHTPSSSRLTLPLEQYEDDDADVEESYAARGLRKKHTTLSSHPATFITVVEMLPATIFWGTVGSVVWYSVAAFDALIELLTGLKMED